MHSRFSLPSVLSYTQRPCHSSVSPHPTPTPFSLSLTQGGAFPENQAVPLRASGPWGSQ